MKSTKVIEGIFKMRFEEIYDCFKKSKLTCEEAAKLLGVSIKTFYRKRQRYESEDFNGNFDLRLGRISPLKATRKEVEMVTKLYAHKYNQFSVRHFYSFAKRDHGLERSYAWTKNTLLNAGLIKKANKPGGTHRLRRERKPMEGMMIHQDGSTHQWIPALDYNLDLIITLDDATSKITSGFIVEQEGTLSTFQGIRETIEKYGLFCSFYTDRGSHYFHTSEAGGKVDKIRLTQVGRALQQLGIRHIAAYSSEARGRSERVFGTIQARLPKELELFNITTIEETNKYLRERFIPNFNEEFSVTAACKKSAYIPWVGTNLQDILCIQENRVVQKDNTVRYEGLVLQIPKNSFRHHYTKAEVVVHKYPDNTLAIFYGHLCIGKYYPDGTLINNIRERIYG